MAAQLFEDVCATGTRVIWNSSVSEEVTGLPLSYRMVCDRCAKNVENGFFFRVSSVSVKFG